MNDLEKKENEIKPEQEQKESFWKKIQKPVKPVIAWSIFGGVVVFVIVLALIIFSNL